MLAVTEHWLNFIKMSAYRELHVNDCTLYVQKFLGAWPPHPHGLSEHLVSNLVSFNVNLMFQCHNDSGWNLSTSTEPFFFFFLVPFSHLLHVSRVYHRFESELRWLFAWSFVHVLPRSMWVSSMLLSFLPKTCQWVDWLH